MKGENQLIIPLVREHLAASTEVFQYCWCCGTVSLIDYHIICCTVSYHAPSGAFFWFAFAFVCIIWSGLPIRILLNACAAADDDMFSS